MAARLTAPAAVLLDLDGTLLDSEPAWSAAARRIAEGQCRTWTTADDLEIVGWSIPAIAAYLQDRGVTHEESRIVDLLHERVGAALAGALPWRPGALRLLAVLRDAAIPCALVTMTYRSLAEVVTSGAPPDSFRAIVAGDDVVRPKPDAEAYLTAARALGVDPVECWAVEDSPTGVAAALGSGAVTYAVDPGQCLPEQLATHPRLRCVAGLGPVIELLERPPRPAGVNP